MNLQDQQTCIKCQECCKWLGFFLDKKSMEKNKSFYQYRGAKVRGTQLLVPSRCQHLVDGVGCAIYKDRPEYCRQYDGRTDPLMKDVCKLPK